MKIPAVTISLCLLLAFGISSVSAQSDALPVTREQSISHLTQLVDVYSIDLTAQEQESVSSVCRQLQSGQIGDLRRNLDEQSDKYREVVDNLDNSIRFTANALRQMSEDSSNMDLASFHLGQDYQNFTSNLNVYMRSLDEILIIDCQVFPEQFAAGLQEARVRRELTQISAEKITKLVDDEVASSLDNVKRTLEKIAGISR